MKVVVLDVRATHINNPICPSRLAQSPSGRWYCVDCGHDIIHKRIEVVERDWYEDEGRYAVRQDAGGANSGGTGQGPERGVIGKVQKVTKESEGVWMTEVSLDVREEDIQKLLGQEFSMGINAKSYQALCKDEAN